MTNKYLGTVSRQKFLATGLDAAALKEHFEDHGFADRGGAHREDEETIAAILAGHTCHYRDQVTLAVDPEPHSSGKISFRLLFYRAFEESAGALATRDALRHLRERHDLEQQPHCERTGGIPYDLGVLVG